MSVQTELQTIPTATLLEPVAARPGDGRPDGSSVAAPWPSSVTSGGQKSVLTAAAVSAQQALVVGDSLRFDIESGLSMELGRIRSRQQQAEGSSTMQQDQDHPGPLPSLSLDGHNPALPSPPRLLVRQQQGVPPELPSLLAEVIFVLVCTAGQAIFCLAVGQVMIAQTPLREALGLPPAQMPWLIGSSALASGLSVIVFGPLADIIPPKPLMVGAFLWEAAWTAVAAGCLRPRLKILFLVSRAMQGLAVGVLVSTPMSILGRVYNPGRRKTRVFSLMAAGAPFGYWIGCVQGGALSRPDHLPWIFGSTALFLALCAVAAQLTIPPLQPAPDHGSSAAAAPTLRQFDYLGAALASLGSGLVLFGLTQGAAVEWRPYTYTVVLLGVLMLVGFHFAEQRAVRPLIPAGLWRTPGFAALLLSYICGFGGYTGAWQIYAIQFWQRYQGASPLTTALYLLPNGLVGLLAAWIVSKTLHRVPGHWIFACSMVCFGLGPVFFLPQTPSTSYWALSMPGVALATFGPDLSFAAATIFVTSSVPRSYQGAAGSLLVTVQNLTLAIATSVADSIGLRASKLPSGEIGLPGIRAIWWFGLASALIGVVLTLTMVRIPKAEEKEHVQ